MIEQERKFIYKKVEVSPLNGIRPILIKQGYFFSEDGITCRVRQSLMVNEITVKVRVDADKSKELNYPITEDTASRLFFDSKYRLSKYRYTVEDNDDYQIIIDVFPTGMALVEIEAKTKYPEILPDYCGKEVTGQYEYTSYALAVQLTQERLFI